MANTIEKKAILIGIALSLTSLVAMFTSNTIIVSLGFGTYFFGIALLSPVVSVLVLESSPREVRGCSPC